MTSMNINITRTIENTFQMILKKIVRSMILKLIERTCVE